MVPREKVMDAGQGHSQGQGLTAVGTVVLGEAGCW